MKRKVLKTGNSFAVTIPSDFVKEVGVDIGDEVSINTDSEKSEIKIKFLHRPKQISLFNKKKK